MKKVLVLIIGLLLSFHHLFSLEGKIGEWKPVEEPKTREEVLSVAKEAGVRRKEAVGELSEAAKEREIALEKNDEDKLKEAEEKIKEADLKISRAEFDLYTSEIGQYKISLEKTVSDDSRQKIEKNLERAKLDRQAVDKKIRSLSQELEAGYEKPPIETAPLSESVQFFVEDMQGEFQRVWEGNPVSNFLDLQAYLIAQMKEKGLPDYKNQKSALETLQKFVEKKVTIDEIDFLSSEEKIEYDTTKQELKDRLNQINEFLKNPPRKIPNNKLAEKLDLENKIPADQVSAIKRENFDLIKRLKELNEMLKDPTRKQEANQAKEEILKSLNEEKIALYVYGLDGKAPKLNTWIDEQIKLFPVEEKPVPSAAQNALELFELSSEELDQQLKLQSEGGKGTLDSVSELLAQPAEIMKKGLQYAARKGGEDLVHLAPKVKKVGDVMAKAPEIADTTIKVLPEVNKSIAVAAKGAAYIPNEKAKKIGTELKKVEKGINDALENKDKIEKAGEFLGWLGEKVKGGAEYVGTFGKWLKEKGAVAPEPLAKEVIEYKEAEQVITKLREDIFVKEQERSRFAPIFEPIKDLAKKIGAWFKEKYTSLTRPNLTQAMGNYSEARTTYLTAIGFSKEEIAQKPTADAIKSKLSKTLSEADAAKKTELENARKNLAKGGNELARTFNSFVDDLQSAVTNYAFLVDGWDVIVPLNKPDIQSKVVNIVNVVSNRRDLQNTYLEMASGGVKGFRDDIAAVTKGTGFEDISNEYLDALERMINDKRIEALVEADVQLATLDTLIKKNRKELETAIQQAATPAGPPS